MASGVPHKLIDVQIQGGDQCRANLRVWAEKFPAATGSAFLGEMQDTMKESQAECPFDYENQHLDGTPHLRDTAQAEIGIQNKDMIVVEGSYATPYAVYVHEILGNHHLWPTKAKFLEDPANRRAKVLVANIRRKLAGLVKDGPIEEMHFETSRWALRRGYTSYLKQHVAAVNERERTKARKKLGHLGGRFV